MDSLSNNFFLLAFLVEFSATFLVLSASLIVCQKKKKLQKEIPGINFKENKQGIKRNRWDLKLNFSVIIMSTSKTYKEVI